MGGARRDTEPPAVPATVAVLLGPVAVWTGIIVPAAGRGQHVFLAAAFGVVCVLSGVRALRIAGRVAAALTESATTDQLLINVLAREQRYRGLAHED